MNGYRWLICVQSYDYEGTEIPKGRMDYTNCRFPLSGKWKTATDKQIENRQYHKGNAFNITDL